MSRTLINTQTSSWPGAAVVGGSGPAVWCVLGGVLLSRTLAGAVPSALSGLASGFGMGAGRFPVAVTTETTVRAVRFDRRVVRLFGCSCVVALSTCHTQRACGWLVVGLGVDRIVDARVSCCLLTPLFDLAYRLAADVGVWGVLLFVLAY